MLYGNISHLLRISYNVTRNGEGRWKKNEKRNKKGKKEAKGERKTIRIKEEPKKIYNNVIEREESGDSSWIKTRKLMQKWSPE